MKKKSPPPAKPMPPIAESRRAAKAAVVFGALLLSSAAAEPPDSPPLEEKVERLEEQFHRQELLALRRVEGVETRMEMLDHNLNRVFLIFGLSAALILALVVGRQRARNRLDGERINRAVREAETLNADIRRELTRPEMEFLRIGHFLRRLMRQFVSHGPSVADAAHIRVIGRDPNVPVSLHYMAQVLSAEYEKRWEDAGESLEQLRQLDPEDPFVLLHLSHVHTRLAEKAGDVRDRKRHRQTANQYYAQFAVAAQVEEMQPPPQIASPPAPPPETSSSPPPAPSPARDAPPFMTAAAPEKPPAPPQSEIAPPPPQMQQTMPSSPQSAAIRETPPPAAAPATSAADALPGAAVLRKDIPPPSAPPQSEIVPPPPQKTPPPAATRQEFIVVASGKSSAAAQKPRAQAAAAQANGGAAAIKTPPTPKAGAGLREAFSGESRRKIGGAIMNGLTGLLSEARNIAGKIGGGNDVAPPFLPVPATSEVPEKAGAAAMEMWKSIRRGDLRMAQAANTPNVRRRNHLIDQALVCYAQAQGHQTNETLYLNWGLSLLGKALHLPEKKREPFFNAAIDKFLAGNVIAPHRFDFSLATLYAIVGREDECRQWLETARQSGTLDAESLRHAPDFDGVRRQPWFAEFMRG